MDDVEKKKPPSLPKPKVQQKITSLFPQIKKDDDDIDKEQQEIIITEDLPDTHTL